MNVDGVADVVTDWFVRTGRKLPWRSTYDPYHIWISEIMLQQTQMARGISYFNRWIERFPDVAVVAAASEQDILKYWEGLGYYARARNLHRAAKIIEAEFSGIVPCDYSTLLSLPGIGPYTAAAVSSIAGNSDIPVIDANVGRVYSRLFNIESPIQSAAAKNRIKALAAELLPAGKARKYNQAIMDFGGLLCLPKNPKCEQCPLSQMCLALQAGTVAERPVVQKKQKTVYRYKVSGLIVRDGRVYIQQRNTNEVWGGLWEFPGGEIGRQVQVDHLNGELIARIIAENCGLTVRVGQHLVTVKHQYTHHNITLECYICKLLTTEKQQASGNFVRSNWVRPEELRKYAFPAGPRKILEHIGRDFFKAISPGYFTS